MISCKEKKAENSFTDNQFDFTKFSHKITNISEKINDSTNIKYEYFISEKDSFINQTRTHTKGKLDTLKSRFYDLTIVKNDGLNHSGHIFYRNYFDTLNLKINENRWVFLFLEQQITKDSIGYRIFASKDGNNISYEYSDFENGYISGYIEDTALVPNYGKDSLGYELSRHLEQPMNIQNIIELK